MAVTGWRKTSKRKLNLENIEVLLVDNILNQGLRSSPILNGAIFILTQQGHIKRVVLNQIYNWRATKPCLQLLEPLNQLQPVHQPSFFLDCAASYPLALVTLRLITTPSSWDTVF